MPVASPSPSVPADRDRARAVEARGQPVGPRGVDPARPRRLVEAQGRVRGPYARAAVPARVRVPVRLPHDRPGRRRRRRPRRRVTLRDRARAGRDRRHDHVPGDPGGGDGARAGVRVHARDRGSRPGAMPDLARRDREGALGRRAGTDRRADRVPGRGRDPRRRRRSPPQRRLAGHDHAAPAGMCDDDLARSPARDRLRGPQPRPHVRVRGVAVDVPRRHLLPVDAARTRAGRGDPLAADPRAREPADLHRRGPAGGSDEPPAHAPLHRLSGPGRLLPRRSSRSGCASSAAGCSPSPRRAQPRSWAGAERILLSLPTSSSAPRRRRRVSARTPAARCRRRSPRTRGSRQGRRGWRRAFEARPRPRRASRDPSRR